ncbi:MAG: response regulator [Azospirillum sp.]|nr:response regulator [Azospirillum sp.]
MAPPLGVLIIEDNPADFLLGERHLKKSGLLAECSQVSDLMGLRAALAARRWDVVLSDFALPGLEFEECLGAILEAQPDVPIILVSGSIGEERAIELFRLGVWDFVIKDNLIRLVPVIRRSLRDAEDRKARRLAERALIESEERLRLTLEAADVLAWEWDPATDAFFESGPVAALFGRLERHRHATLQAFLDDIHAVDRASVGAKFRSAAAGASDSCRTEFRIALPDGGVRWAMVAGSLLNRGPEAGTRLLGILRDVTEHHEALSNLTVAKEHAEAASIAKSQFLATMSHELRTPLNPIIGYSDFLRMTEQDPKRRENLDIICETGQTLLRLIQDILDLSLIEAGKVTVDISNLDLADELGQITTLFRAEARRRGLELSVSIAPTAPRQLRGDPGLLRQVLVNLVGNALKFTPEGQVSVAVELAAAESGATCVLVFHVSDTGIGIRPENQQRIFEIFEQEDNSLTRKFGGTGLGLAICRRLVALLGGRIWLDSAVGAGSRFSFTASFDVLSEPGGD